MNPKKSPHRNPWWIPAASRWRYVDITMTEVFFQEWSLSISLGNRFYLLRHQPPENLQQFRDLTLRLYGGDRTSDHAGELLGHRFWPFACCGLGRSTLRLSHRTRATRAFLTLELTAREMSAGKTAAEALDEKVRNASFTTTRPVEAGQRTVQSGRK